MAKTVFIDFDGTFAAHGVIPAGHIRAVHEARRNGHRVLLCTGRPKALVDPELLATFDGMVGAAGAYVELDGTVLLDRRFPAALAPGWSACSTPTRPHTSWRPRTRSTCRRGCTSG